MAIPVLAKYGCQMRDDTNTWFAESVKTLTYNRNQRVWSIIVTLFGDLARGPGDRISGAALSQITEAMSIKPEAMRVALHRLRNDKWISSEKSGRNSLYFLTERGREQSNAASHRIYMRDMSYPVEWQLCVLDPGEKGTRNQRLVDMKERGFVGLAPGVFLGPTEALPLANVMKFHGSPETLPDWVRQKIGSPDAHKVYVDLERALDTFENLLQSKPLVSPIEVATLRTIIVHIWRRALFSHPELPPGFFPEGWRGVVCRAKVMDALDTLGRPTPEQLNAAA